MAGGKPSYPILHEMRSPFSAMTIHVPVTDGLLHINARCDTTSSHVLLFGQVGSRATTQQWLHLLQFISPNSYGSELISHQTSTVRKHTDSEHPTLSSTFSWDTCLDLLPLIAACKLERIALLSVIRLRLQRMRLRHLKMRHAASHQQLPSLLSRRHFPDNFAQSWPLAHK